MDLIRDLNAFDVSALTKPGSIWVVAEVTIDPGSNIPLIKSVPETGPNAKLVETVFFAGKAKVLSKVHGEFEKTEWDFRWDNPRINRGARTAAAAIASSPSAHLHNGVFALQIDLQNDADKQFQTIVELPDATWAPYVAEAAEFASAHADMLAVENIEKNRKELAVLSAGKNPLLALAAFRLLTRDGLPDAPVTSSAISNAPYIVQALM